MIHESFFSFFEMIAIISKKLFRVEELPDGAVQHGAGATT